MLIGYLLVQTADADALLGQRQALADVGCEQVVEDGSGSVGQPGLRELLGRLQGGLAALDRGAAQARIHMGLAARSSRH